MKKLILIFLFIHCLCSSFAQSRLGIDSVLRLLEVGKKGGYYTGSEIYKISDIVCYFKTGFHDLLL